MKIQYLRPTAEEITSLDSDLVLCTVMHGEVQEGLVLPPDITHYKAKATSVRACVEDWRGRIGLIKAFPKNNLGEPVAADKKEYELPGGKMMRHETPSEAMQRELMEELGVRSYAAMVHFGDVVEFRFEDGVHTFKRSHGFWVAVPKQSFAESDLSIREDLRECEERWRKPKKATKSFAKASQSRLIRDREILSHGFSIAEQVRPLVRFC